MKAIVGNGPDTVSVVDRPEPIAGPGEVLVRPTYTSVDASAVAAAGGAVVGSALAGVVIAIGPDVDGWATGDRVSVDPRSYCGSCLQCRAGRYSTCEREHGGLGMSGVDGALAEQVVVRAANCYAVPAGVTDLEAALVPSVVAATHAVRFVGIGVADNVGVFGLDDVGLATLALARSLTTGTVVAADAVERRRSIAAGLGADLVVDPATDGAASAILAAAPEGLDSVFLSLPEQLPEEDDLLLSGFAVLRLQGTVVLTQLGGNRAWERMQSNPYLPLQREATIQNAGGGAQEDPLLGGRTNGDWVATLRAFDQKRLDARSLDVHVVAFDGIRTAADLTDALALVPATASKVVFSMGAVTS